MATRRRDLPSEDPFAAIGCEDVVPIGAGGSSLVYRARQRAFDRLIALKVLSMPLTDERARRRFERELALAGRLTGHPNVVTVFASGFFGDGRAYVEMEYCPGGSLADRLAAQGPLPVRDVVGIGVKIAGVLELARLGGIVHRDVKPANVLVTRFGEPALADFGIAIVSGEMTSTTQALTPVHAAPEVLESRGAGPAADQWSLGSTLHTLLAGRAPFATGDDEGLLAGMLRILNDPVPVIPRGDVPETLRSVLARAMAKVPEDRWPGPTELGKALQEVERRQGWPVTTLPTEEVAESRYATSGDPITADPITGGIDPRATHTVPVDAVDGAAASTAWPPPAGPVSEPTPA
ncbi:MAG: serine/threonine protein kinase, partial [Actinomycetota bacterium]|nr:serine/threonine protein kinase [Actinomycetota bacterium]